MSAFAVIRASSLGGDDGEEIESIRFPLSRPVAVALCVYLVDKFWRKITMTTIITRAAVVVLVRRGTGGREEAGPVCVYESRVFWDAVGGEAAAAHLSESSLSRVDRILNRISAHPANPLHLQPSGNGRRAAIGRNSPSP